MKKLEYRIAAMFVGLVFILSSCGDDGLNPGPRSTPVTDEISGNDEVDISPLTQTYSVPNRAGSTYAWTATGVGTISGEATGNSIQVLFAAAGTTTLTVTESNDLGTAAPVELTVESEVGSLGISRVFTINSAIKEGDLDTVVVVFNKEVANTPSFSLSPGDGIRTLGSLSQTTGIALTVEDTAAFDVEESDFLANDALAAYWVGYTAGQGNGNPVLNITGATATASWGGATMSAATASITRVDNTTPSPKVSLATDLAKFGDGDIALTVTFAEAIDSTFLTITATLGGVVWEGDTLEFDGEDGTTWTAVYPVPEGDGLPSFTISAGATDAAGNVAGAVVIAGDDDIITVDNTAPTVGTLTATEITSDSNQATLTAISNEDGTIFYTVVEDGTAINTIDDVTDPLIAVENGSKSADGGDTTSITTSVLGSGSYDVYFFSVDEAGNEGALSAKVDLTID